MDRLITFCGRFARRQALDLPILDGEGQTHPSPSRPATTSAASVSTSVPASSSTSVPQAPSSTSISTTSSLPDRTSTSVPAAATSSTTDPNTVILVQTTVPAGGGTATATPPSANTQVSVVIENTTVTNAAVPSSSVSPDKAGAASSSFLNNKVASGVVFGVCGLVGLLLIFLIVWFAMRKHRRIKKLEKEIISFDPEDVGRFHQRKDVETASVNSTEKAGNMSASSLDNYAGNGYSATMNVDNGGYRNAAPFADYHPSQMGIQRPGNVAFNPMANSAMDYSRSHVIPPQNFNR